jgi:hypothetical protein
MANDDIQQRVFRQLLRRETGPKADAPAVAAAASRLYERFANQLAPLVGDAGVAAIYARSLHLVQQRVPGLTPIPAAEQEDELKRTYLFLSHQQPAEAAEAAVAVITTVSELMASFIGDSLTRSLLREAWPDDFTADTTEETQ